MGDATVDISSVNGNVCCHILKYQILQIFVKWKAICNLSIYIILLYSSQSFGFKLTTSVMLAGYKKLV